MLENESGTPPRHLDMRTRERSQSMVEAVQNYVNLVTGVTKATRAKALSTARALLAHAGLEGVANEAGDRVSKLAEEIMLASRANRELVENLVAAEVDKAASRWGFVRTDDVEALREEIDELRRSLIRATTDPAPSGRPPGAPPEGPPARASGRRPRRAAPGQQPPLGGVPDEEGVELSHPELIRSKPLPYEPGPIQPNAERRTGTKGPAPRSSAARKPSPRTAAARKAAARISAAKKAASPAAPALSPEQHGDDT